MTMARSAGWDEQSAISESLEILTRANGGISSDGLGDYLSFASPRDMVGRRAVYRRRCRSAQTSHNPANNEGGGDRFTKVDEPDKWRRRLPFEKAVLTALEVFSSVARTPSILPQHILAQYANIINVPRPRTAGRHRAVQIRALG